LPRCLVHRGRTLPKIRREASATAVDFG